MHTYICINLFPSPTYSAIAWLKEGVHDTIAYCTSKNSVWLGMATCECVLHGLYTAVVCKHSQTQPLWTSKGRELIKRLPEPLEHDQQHKPPPPQQALKYAHNRRLHTRSTLHWTGQQHSTRGDCIPHIRYTTHQYTK